MNLYYQVEKDGSGRTVKSLLKQKLHLSEKLIKKLKLSQRILLNGQAVFVNKEVMEGDLLEVRLDFVEESEDVLAQDLPIQILYEDELMVVVDKKPGIVVHPTFGHPTGTVANALMHHLRNQGLSVKIRPVSRLDRDTSGVIIFAKNAFVQEFFIRQMQDRSLTKEYIGIVHGIVNPPRGTIDLPIDRKPGSIMLREVSATGYPSVTHYEVLTSFSDASYVKFKLETGRTHQIRVHCQAIGHPLLGDTLYSDATTPLISRQALHSNRVGFIHPVTKERMEITAPMPEDLEQVLEALSSQENSPHS